ncbi:hypothetical protein D3C76_1385130 [compost metagenome]
MRVALVDRLEECRETCQHRFVGIELIAHDAGNVLHVFRETGLPALRLGLQQQQRRQPDQANGQNNEARERTVAFSQYHPDVPARRATTLPWPATL